jgi:Uma2 family endonuclease
MVGFSPAGAGGGQAMSVKTRAMIEDLYKVEGKAELVDGEIVAMPPAGDEPGRAGFYVATNLLEYEKRTRSGRAYPDGVGFRVDLPHRESFSPDAAYHIGQRTGMRFLDGAPIFAVEVRSENDYGAAAEEKMKQKRADYFACGTQVVWDVDLRSEDVVKVYRASAPENPTIYQRGDMAEAEPAVPGWRMAVDELFG